VIRAAESVGRDTDDLPMYVDDEVEEMLTIIQNLDPPGVGARDLRECLMLQLREAGLEQSVPFRLVRDCFEELIITVGVKSPSGSASAQRRAARRRRDQELDPKPG